MKNQLTAVRVRLWQRSLHFEVHRPDFHETMDVTYSLLSSPPSAPLLQNILQPHTPHLAVIELHLGTQHLHEKPVQKPDVAHHDDVPDRPRPDAPWSGTLSSFWVSMLPQIGRLASEGFLEEK